MTKTLHRSGYTKMKPDGSYEYGHCIQQIEPRNGRTRLVALGVEKEFENAERRMLETKGQWGAFSA